MTKRTKIICTLGPAVDSESAIGNLIQAGDNIFLTEENIPGTSRRIHQTFIGLHEYVEPGTIILMDDGLIELAVDRVIGTDVQCTIQNSGVLCESKQINFPDTDIPLPVMTEQDKEDLLFGVE